MSTQIPRWTNVPFPAYTYVPGQTPHPIREEAGHSFGREEPSVQSFDPNCWDQCPAFLFGLDLFNAGFYWESHEQWEAVWHAVGRQGPVANFLKGLIKLSAAGVKSLEGRPVGVTRHLRRASELFNGVMASAVGFEETEFCGLNLRWLSQKSQTAVEAIECATDQQAACLAAIQEFPLEPSRLL